jgi:hypothetical protein
VAGRDRHLELYPTTRLELENYFQCVTRIWNKSELSPHASLSAPSSWQRNLTNYALMTPCELPWYLSCQKNVRVVWTAVLSTCWNPRETKVRITHQYCYEDKKRAASSRASRSSFLPLLSMQISSTWTTLGPQPDESKYREQPFIRYFHRWLIRGIWQRHHTVQFAMTGYFHICGRAALYLVACSFYFLISVVGMRKYCDGQTNRSRYFDGFTRFQPPMNTKKWFWNAVCPHICVDVAWTVERI